MRLSLTEEDEKLLVALIGFIIFYIALAAIYTYSVLIPAILVYGSIYLLFTMYKKRRYEKKMKKFFAEKRFTKGIPLKITMYGNIVVVRVMNRKFAGTLSKETYDMMKRDITDYINSLIQGEVEYVYPSEIFAKFARFSIDPEMINDALKTLFIKAAIRQIEDGFHLRKTDLKEFEESVIRRAMYDIHVWIKVPLKVDYYANYVSEKIKEIIKTV